MKRVILFILKKTGLLFIVASVCISFPSCVDTDPAEVLDYEDFYNNLDDADAAILGLYGQFMDLASQVVVLNELRADLMDVTPNATTDLQEISLSRPSKNNPWADVSKFYGVVQSCNDMLDNFNEMQEEKKMTIDEYNERYSDVAALRCWVYLQLGIHFGKVPYITSSIVSIDDLALYKDRELELDALIDSLVVCMENVPTLENYKASKLVQSTLDGYSLAPFFINKKCLMGDLYLFADRYREAAVMYRDVMGASEDIETYNNEKYKLHSEQFNVSYTSGKEDDAGSLINNWETMFSAAITNRNILNEMIWFFSYDKKFAPRYSLLELFNPSGSNGGKYYLKPSDYAVESVWGGEEQKNGYPFDARGLTGAYNQEGDNYYIRKYSLFPSSLDQTGNWFLYRAGLLHLRYAEAANRAGYPFLAWALINNGLYGNFQFKRVDGSAYPADSLSFTGTSPFNPYPAPFYFDARMSSAPRPFIRAPWRSNSGLRGRASLPNTPFPETCVTQQDSILFVEKMIAHEAALEMGFEGHRWADLVRIGRRLNKETPGKGDHFLWDENLAKKYRQSGENADLSSEDKWYLPLYK